MNDKNVRTRFAPSPTGFLHVGGVRTALFCWLLARKHEGTFILRIEDTDQKRKITGAIEHIQDSMSWLEIEPDEGVGSGGKFGPYLQSDRREIYRKYADKLLESGRAYADPYTKEELESLRAEAKKADKLFRFREHRPEDPPEYDGSQPLRFRMPNNKQLQWDDAVRGKINFEAKDLDDFIVLKSDGFPTYNFANVIDDHLMQISHVLRGEEFVSSTPLHLLLYEAFDWQPPKYAHLPQVNAEDGKKLSKRHGAASVTEYRKNGYLPEALVNFLSLLGWNDGTEQEIYSRDDLIKAFSLDDINPSPAVFDREKLNWLNGEYMKKLSFEEKFERSEGFWPVSAEEVNDDFKKAVLTLVDDRMQYFGELKELTEFFFTDPEVGINDLASKKLSTDRAKHLLAATIEKLESQKPFNRDNIENALRGLVKEEGSKAGVLFPLVRMAITGTHSSPPLFDTINVLGKQTVLRRLKILTAPQDVSASDTSGAKQAERNK